MASSWQSCTNFYFLPLLYHTISHFGNTRPLYVITRPLALHRHSCDVSLIANGSFTYLVRALILVLSFVTCPASGNLPDPISFYINRSEGSVLSTHECSEVLAQCWVGSMRLINGCSCGLSRHHLCGGHFRSARVGASARCVSSLHVGVSQRAV